MSKGIVYNRDSLAETIKGFGEQMTGAAEELADICMKRKCKSITFGAGIFPNELPVLRVDMQFMNDRVTCPLVEVTSLDEVEDENDKSRTDSSDD